MSSQQPSTAALLAEITALRREVSALQRQKGELELLLEMTAEHSDGVTEDLHQKVWETQRESAFGSWTVLTRAAPGARAWACPSRATWSSCTAAR